RLRAVAGAAATGAPARALANVGCRRDRDPADGAGAGRALAGEHPRPARLGHRISVRGRARTLAHAGANAWRRDRAAGPGGRGARPAPAHARAVAHDRVADRDCGVLDARPAGTPLSRGDGAAAEIRLPVQPGVARP